jgi:hypothetical protein
LVYSKPALIEMGMQLGGDRMKWQVGDVTITQFVEIDTLGGKEYILPQATPEALRRLKFLCPHFADKEGRIRMTIHSFLVETPTRRIIIDIGMGNDKQNRTQSSWNDARGRFSRISPQQVAQPTPSTQCFALTSMSIMSVGIRFFRTVAGFRRSARRVI